MLMRSITPIARTQIEALERLVAERDDALAVPRVTAEFLHTLVLAGGFRRGLEIGTSYGYSGVWLGSAFQHNGGVLETIDHDARKTTHATQAFAAAGLADTVTAHQGDAADVIAKLDAPFDFVFIDADKERCSRYLELVWPLLGHHATLVTDNVTSHEAQLRDFVRELREHDRLTSILVPIGSGLELTVKVAPGQQQAFVDGADWVI